jgi:hypothetical protein
MPNPIPFVCFRGTVNTNDMLADAKSLILVRNESKNSTDLGMVGEGMLEGFTTLRDLCNEDTSQPSPLICGGVRIVDKTLYDMSLELAQQYGGLLITGHSLGKYIISYRISAFLNMFNRWWVFKSTGSRVFI